MSHVTGLAASVVSEGDYASPLWVCQFLDARTYERARPAIQFSLVEDPDASLDAVRRIWRHRPNALADAKA